MEERADVIVVGGGPAGLSAALVLVRSRRTVLVIDSGQPRNARSHGMHGYLTRDGILPPDFLRLGCEEVQRYGVRVLHDEVTEAHGHAGGFNIVTVSGRRFQG